MNKMKIVPVKVPWMISPSEEIYKYCGGVNFVNITTCCLKSKEERKKIVNKLNEKYNNNIPDEIWNRISYMSIELHFEPINYFGILYPQKLLFGLDKELYDTSLLDLYYDGNLDFHKAWNENIFCPNPKIYVVENSILKRKLNITNPAIKHWLITGHDEEIHILSETFTWKEL